MNDSLFHEVKQAVKNWWVSLIVGILAVAFAFWAAITPASTLVALVLVFVCWFLVSGIFEIVFALSNRKILSGWGWHLAGGIFDVLIGVILLSLPPASLALIMLYFVGFWLMFRSLWVIGESFDLKSMRIKDWWWFLILGILMLVASFIFILCPIITTGFIVALISVAFFLYGAFRIYLAFRLKDIHKQFKNIEE